MAQVGAAVDLLCGRLEFKGRRRDDLAQCLQAADAPHPTSSSSRCLVLQDGRVIAIYGFLYSSYIPALPYWETTEMVRKFALAFIPVRGMGGCWTEGLRDSKNFREVDQEEGRQAGRSLP